MDRIRFRIEHNPDRGEFSLLSRITGDSTEFLIATFPDEDAAIAEMDARVHVERQAWRG